MTPVENKVVAQTLTHLLVLVAGFLAARYGLALTPELSAEIAAGASVIGGAAAGYLARHTPRAEATLEAALDVLAANGALDAQVPEEPTDARDDEVPEPSADVPPM